MTKTIRAITLPFSGLGVAQKKTGSSEAIKLNQNMQADLEKQVSQLPPETGDGGW